MAADNAPPLALLLVPRSSASCLVLVVSRRFFGNLSLLGPRQRLLRLPTGPQPNNDKRGRQEPPIAFFDRLAAGGVTTFNEERQQG